MEGSGSTAALSSVVHVAIHVLFGESTSFSLSSFCLPLVLSASAVKGRKEGPLLPASAGYLVSVILCSA